MCKCGAPLRNALAFFRKTTHLLGVRVLRMEAFGRTKSSWNWEHLNATITALGPRRSLRMLLGAARAHRRLVGIRSRSAFEKGIDYYSAAVDIGSTTDTAAGAVPVLASVRSRSSCAVASCHACASQASSSAQASSLESAIARAHLLAVSPAALQHLLRPPLPSLLSASVLYL
jgi:hypothetical protein